MHSVQQPIFDFNEYFALEQSDRLLLVLQTINAERLLHAIDGGLDLGRAGFPARLLWSALIAGVVYRVPSVAELRRHLRSNPYMRFVCNIGSAANIPSEATFSRFLTRLIKHEKLLDECIDNLVQRFAALAPGFGETVAADSTDIHAFARGKKSGSADPDATWSAKGSKEANSKRGRKARPPKDVSSAGESADNKKARDKYWWFVAPSTSLSQLTGESPVKVGIRPAL